MLPASQKALFGSLRLLTTSEVLDGAYESHVNFFFRRGQRLRRGPRACAPESRLRSQKKCMSTGSRRSRPWTDTAWCSRKKAAFDRRDPLVLSNKFSRARPQKRPRLPNYYAQPPRRPLEFTERRLPTLGDPDPVEQTGWTCSFAFLAALWVKKRLFFGEYRPNAGA